MRRPSPLVTKLAQFYADRTLTKAPITPADQAEAYFLWVTDRPEQDDGADPDRRRRSCTRRFLR